MPSSGDDCLESYWARVLPPDGYAPTTPHPVDLTDLNFRTEALQIGLARGSG